MARIKNITLDCADPQRLGEFWSAATGYQIESSSELHAYLLPASIDLPRMLLLRVPEPRSGKNRMHVDLEADDRVAEVQRLVALGAIQGDSHDEFGIQWTVMQDPEGNEFCVAAPHA